MLLHHTIHIDISVGSLMLSMLVIICIGFYVSYRWMSLKQFIATLLAKYSLITNVGIKYQSSSTISTSTTASATATATVAVTTTEYNLVKKPSYRIEEERSKLSSSEYTRRGMLWSQRASWNLPTIKRQKKHSSMLYNSHHHHSMQGGIELIKSILDRYEVDIVTGFLTASDPLQRLPYARYHLWEDLADDLPKLLGARLGQAREPLKHLPVLAIDKLITHAQLRRAHLLLCLFAHAYIFGGNEPLDELPEGISIPLCEVSNRLDIPPVLSHTSIVLYNWRRLDVGAEICMENLSTLNNFFDGRDESWFYLITVEIEAKGASCIAPMLLAIDSIQRYKEEQQQQNVDKSNAKYMNRNHVTDCYDHNDNEDDNDDDDRCDGLQRNCERGSSYQHVMDDLSDVTPEMDPGCNGLWLEDNSSSSSEVHSEDDRGHHDNNDHDNNDHYNEYDVLHGELSVERTAGYVTSQLQRIAISIQAMTFSLNSMREGCHPFIFYHRVRPFLSGWKHNPTLPHGIIYKGVSDNRQQFYGGSAAQSSLLPMLDIGLGIKHEQNKSREFLQAMRDYMLKPHREFLLYLESTACIRQYVEELIMKYHIHVPTCPLEPASSDATATTHATTTTVAPLNRGSNRGVVNGRRNDDNNDDKGSSDSSSIESPSRGRGGIVAIDVGVMIGKREEKTRHVVEKLVSSYNDCVNGLKDFRSAHMRIVAEYILAQQQSSGGGSSSSGGSGSCSMNSGIQTKQQTSEQQLSCTASDRGDDGDCRGRSDGRDHATAKTDAGVVNTLTVPLLSTTMSEDITSPTTTTVTTSTAVAAATTTLPPPIVSILPKIRSSLSLQNCAGGKGTGGTDLMNFLRPIRDDCRDSLLLGQKKTEQQSLEDNTPHPQIDFQHDDSNDEGHCGGRGPRQGQAVEEVVMNKSLLGASLPVATSLDDKIPVTSGADLYYIDNGCCQDIDIYRGAAKPSSTYINHHNTNSSSSSRNSDASSGSSSDHDVSIDVRNSCYNGSTIDVIDMEWEVPRSSSSS